MTLLQRWLGWAVPATPQERAAALWSFAYFFMLLAGYYILRPLRDRMGIAGGVKTLPWMFTATFVTLLVMQPVYGALVAKLPRARFIAVVYHFFVANLALFWLLLTLGVAPVVVARVFFVWVSVFSLFAVAVFWSFTIGWLSLVIVGAVTLVMGPTTEGVATPLGSFELGRYSVSIYRIVVIAISAGAVLATYVVLRRAPRSSWACVRSPRGAISRPGNRRWGRLFVSARQRIEPMPSSLWSP